MNTTTPRPTVTRPTVTVLPNPTTDYPSAYALVSCVPLATYAGHWAPAGAAHAGMWVVPFPTEGGALEAAHRLRKTGNAS